MRRPLWFAYVCIVCLCAFCYGVPPFPTQAQDAINIPAGDVEALRTAIKAAVQNGKPATLNLAKDATYLFTKADTSQVFNGGTLQNRKDYSDGDDALPLITTAITINGNGAILKRQGEARFRFFTIFVSGSLTLRELTLENGASSADGGAILDLTPGLTVGLTATKVVFKNNHSDHQGGALDTTGHIQLDDCQFIDNQAVREGGAIYVSGGALTVRGGLFQKNLTTTGTSYGGAINTDEGTHLNVQGTQFSENVAASGGAIAVNGTAMLKNAIFTGNRSVDRGQNDVGGGAVYVGNYAELGVLDSTFTDNHAEKGGGALAVNESRQITITTSLFANNVADKASGAGALVFLTTNATEQPVQATVNQNCFLNNTMQLGQKSIPETMFISASFGGVVTLDAANNWWGSANGPTPEQRGLGKDRGANLSAPFTYEPFLKAAPTFCSGATPTPGKVFAAPTASTPTAEPDCTQIAEGAYKVTAPKGALPAGAKLNCTLDGGNLTLVTITQGGQPIQAFNPPLKVCLKGKGTLQFFNLFGGTSKFAAIASTTEGDYTCAQIKAPGVIGFKRG
jgi:predicted outer membrane repeat protein